MNEEYRELRAAAEIMQKKFSIEKLKRLSYDELTLLLISLGGFVEYLEMLRDGTEVKKP